MSALKARPTEYKGIVYRSKSEAMFARYLELSRLSFSTKSCFESGVSGGGFGIKYEPDWLEVDGWRPDFYVWHVLQVPTACLKVEIIEYKPSIPTETYIQELGVRFSKLGKKVKMEESALLYYGGPFSGSDIGIIQYILFEGQVIQTGRVEWDWLCGLNDAVTGYRYDLSEVSDD